MVNNEELGISCEVAISDYFNVEVNPTYRERANKDIVQTLINDGDKLFKGLLDFKPTKHIAEDKNPVDFILENNKTLSVKSNKKFLGKAAPQIIGQPTSNTFFEHFKDRYGENGSSLSYEEKSAKFKDIVFKDTHYLVNEYFNHLFDTDYYIHIYKEDDIYKSIFLRKNDLVFNLDKQKYSWTQTKETWNESNTIKYDGLTLGEFQIHKNRDCFKFRFDVQNLLYIINKIKNQ